MTGMGDVSNHLHSVLRAPLTHRIPELCRLLETLPFKDLQAIYPRIVGSIFGNGGAAEDWGLRTITRQYQPYDFDYLFNFLYPLGPLFNVCYKLIGDPHLKYAFPARLLPLDVHQMLECGRVSQFYVDIINVDPQTRQIISLNLNPFDYYMFHFAVHLYSASYMKGAYDTWNSLYYTLACEYLLHFLPSDPNTQIFPHIAYFTGKTPAVSPMQTNNRHSQFSSLLLCQEAVGQLVSGVTAGSGNQLHPRGEVWRSETVLQVFIDIWLSTSTQNEVQQISSTSFGPVRSTFPACEHVRIVRSLVKQCLGFALAGSVDPTSLGELRRAALGALAPRALAHIRHLMHIWPLDSSFRLVLELWFSFIQPWRYASLRDENNMNARVESSTEDLQRPIMIDPSFMSFMTENLLAYTEIFQLVFPRFLRLDLTAPKNAIMAYRLTKVFSQSNLVQMLTEVENSVTCEMEPPIMSSYSQMPANISTSYMSPGGITKLNESMEHSFTSGSFPQSSFQNSSTWANTSRLETAGSGQYRPLLSGQGRTMARSLLLHMQQALSQATEVVAMREEKVKTQKRGFFGQLSFWLFGENDSTEEITLDELKNVPVYINKAIKQLADIFSFDLSEQTPQLHRDRFLQSSFNNNNYGSVTRRNIPNVMISPQQANERAGQIKMVGDPDLQPIKTYENGFLVRVLQQISSKLNEMYAEEMKVMWEREDFLGILSREVLKAPCEIHNFCKTSNNDSRMITQVLPPRMSLRPLASHVLLFWFLILCLLSHFLGYGAPLCTLFLITVWVFLLIFKSLIKKLTMASRRVNRPSAPDFNSFDHTMNDSTRDWDQSR